MVIRLPLILLAACLAPPAVAATPIDETRRLDPRGEIEIENLKGRIEVRTWNRPEVAIRGSLGDGVERLRIEGEGSKLEVRVEYPRNGRGTEPTTLLLTVPTLASVDIESVSADVDVAGSAGERLEIESVSGAVSAVGAPAQADIESVSGDLRLNLNSRSVSLESVSGGITLRGKVSGEIAVETVSGDIDVDSRGQALRRVDSSSVSGNADIRTGLADGGRLRAESVSGDIRVRAPKALSARVRGESFSGSLEAPDARINRSRHGPGSDFQHTYGAGSGEISLETFSGDARLELE
jgi:DUF4097 and DUF4098 domain-containing protein YvlB